MNRPETRSTRQCQTSFFPDFTQQKELKANTSVNRLQAQMQTENNGIKENQGCQDLEPALE